MRRVLLACLTLVAVPGVAHAGYGDVVEATPGVVAYWPLDDTASPVAPEVGSLPGTISGTHALGQPGGIDVGGTSLGLWNGGSVSVGSAAELNLAGGRTIEAWVAPTSTSNQRHIVSRGTSTSGYHLYLDPGAVPVLRVGRSTVRAPALRSGGWHHLVATFDGSALAIYVNGRRTASDTYSGGTTTSVQELWIGRYSNSSSGYYRFQGGLDELALYDRALTADEAAAHFHAGADTAPPQTVFTAAPSPVSPDPDGTIAFSASKGGVTFSCTLDDDGPQPCPGSFSYDLLRDGQHALAVTATDRWGTTQTTTLTWRVALPAAEQAPPVTTFAVTPSAVTNSRTATFAFSGSKRPLTYACRLDGGAWSACAGSVAYHHLHEATHTLEVRATDRWGVTETSPATFRWTIDTTPPDTFVLASMARRGDAGSAVLGSEPGATFECRSANGGWAPCPAAFPLPALAEAGQLHVRAIDGASNADPSPALVVIRPAPIDAPITFGGATVSFDVGGIVDLGAMRCSLSGAPATACAWPLTFSNLAYGQHTLTITDPNLPGVVFPTIAWTDPLPAPRIVGSQFPAVLQLGSRRKQATLAASRLPRILFQSNSAGAARVWLRRGKQAVRRWRSPVVQGSNLVRLPRTAWRGLRPGRYRLVVVVANESGASAPLTLRFDAVRSTRR